MSALHVKGIPVKLYSRIKKSARENRRSLNNEAIFRLEQAYGFRAPDSFPSVSRGKRRIRKKHRTNKASS